MTKKELQELLKAKSVRPDSYSLNGGLPNEAYCLNEIDGIWEVYYSERGNKSGIKKCNSEEEACDYLFKLLIANF